MEPKEAVGAMLPGTPPLAPRPAPTLPCSTASSSRGTSPVCTPTLAPMPISSPLASATVAMATSGSRGTSPAPAIAVPLITPRYQRKTRTANAMEVTDSTSGEENAFSATELLRQRSIEALHIKHGCATYDEHIRFHAYALFRHGARAIVTQSVGYSSDGDLVLQRHDVAEAADSMTAKRVHSEVAGAVCLDPAARRPLTDTEAAANKHVNPSKLKKYPGVKCPKNRKIRNRLRNDHFANPFARELYDATCEGGSGEGSDRESRPAFGDVPPSFRQLLHKDEEHQLLQLEKKGISPVLRPMSGLAVEADPNAGDARFAQLSSKLKDELRRALGSEVLSSLIIELEKRFAAYIQRARDGGVVFAGDDKAVDEHQPSAANESLVEAAKPTTPSSPAAPKPLSIEGLDGYGRLICHGVASYYRLNSQSFDNECGERVTMVTLPKKARSWQLPATTLYDFMKAGRGGKGCGSEAAVSDLTPFSLDGDSDVIQMHKKTRKGGKRR